MDVPPGLLPENPQRRFPIGRAAAIALIVAAAVVAIVAVNQLQRVNRDRDRLEADLQKERSKPRALTPQNESKDDADAIRRERDLQNRVSDLERRIAGLEGQRPASEGGTSTPDRKRGDMTAALETGQAAFRRGDYKAAERQFLQAEIAGATSGDPYGWLGLIRWVQGAYLDAWLSLRLAFLADPNWLKGSANPDTYFSSREEYLKYLSALESFVEKNPTSSEAKLFLAYLYYHEKGMNQAQYIVSQILAASPDNPDAQSFQKQLDAASH